MNVYLKSLYKITYLGSNPIQCDERQAENRHKLNRRTESLIPLPTQLITEISNSQFCKKSKIQII